MDRVAAAARLGAWPRGRPARSAPPDRRRLTAAQRPAKPLVPVEFPSLRPPPRTDARRDSPGRPGNLFGRRRFRSSTSDVQSDSHRAERTALSDEAGSRTSSPRTDRAPSASRARPERGTQSRTTGPSSARRAVVALATTSFGQFVDLAEGVVVSRPQDELVGPTTRRPGPSFRPGSFQDPACGLP
jgi:hypothetical protein